MRRRLLLTAAVLVLPLLASGCGRLTLPWDFAATPPRRMGSAIVHSPNGALQATIATSGTLAWSATAWGADALTTGRLGLRLRDWGEAGRDVRLVTVERRQVKEAWRPVGGMNADASVRFNEAAFLFEERDARKTRFELVVRASDDALALRWRIPEQPALARVAVAEECVEFFLPLSALVWAAAPGGTVSEREDFYERRRFMALRAEGGRWGMPLTAQLGRRLFLAVLEADRGDWPGALLTGDADGALRTELVGPPSDDAPVEGAPPLVSPWRVVLFGREARDLAASQTIEALNPPCALESTDWIAAGVAAAEPQLLGESVADAQAVRRRIDLAARMAWPYACVGRGWYGTPDSESSDPVRPVAGFDFEGLLRAAAAQNVRLWLWVDRRDLRRKGLAETLDAYAAWGVAGVRIAGFEREDQRTVRERSETIRAAAARRLMLAFEGGVVPSGERRTWPHVLAWDAVAGLEWNLWGRAFTPEHATTLPFTRLLAGPADVGAACLENRTALLFEPGPPLDVCATRAGQIASAVVFSAPLTRLAAQSEELAAGPETEFLRALPAQWDETRILSGAPGDYFVVARRSGRTWRLAAIAGPRARILDVPLDFLGWGGHDALIVRDALDSEKRPDHVIVEERRVGAGDVLRVPLAPGGGCAVLIGD